RRSSSGGGRHDPLIARRAVGTAVLGQPAASPTTNRPRRTTPPDPKNLDSERSLEATGEESAALPGGRDRSHYVTITPGSPSPKFHGKRGNLPKIDRWASGGSN